MVMGFGHFIELSADECWELLRSASLARVAATAAGLVDIFPATFAVNDDDHALYFRTAPGTQLLELAINDQVALEIDEHDDRVGWCVVVKGRAERVDRQSCIEIAERLGLTPWLPALPYRWMRIAPTAMLGHRFALGPTPSRAA